MQCPQKLDTIWGIFMERKSNTFYLYTLILTTTLATAINLSAIRCYLLYF
jgi:hypothetical protein